jgi:hypothetical protein
VASSTGPTLVRIMVESSRSMKGNDSAGFSPVSSRSTLRNTRSAPYQQTRCVSKPRPLKNISWHDRFTFSVYRKIPRAPVDPQQRSRIPTYSSRLKELNSLLTVEENKRRQNPRHVEISRLAGSDNEDKKGQLGSSYCVAGIISR